MSEHTMRCLVCQGTAFSSRKVLLNTRSATFFGIDWLDPNATAVTCRQCGFIHWFDREVDLPEPPPPSTWWRKSGPRAAEGD